MLAACVLLSLLVSAARAQNCRVTTLETLPDVVAPCCEAMPGSGSCRDGFPTVCPQICATGLVAFWNDCDATIAIFPDDYFQDFLISDVQEITASCRQVTSQQTPEWG